MWKTKLRGQIIKGSYQGLVEMIERSKLLGNPIVKFDYKY